MEAGVGCPSPPPTGERWWDRRAVSCPGEEFVEERLGVLHVLGVLPAQPVQPFGASITLIGARLPARGGADAAQHVEAS